MDTFKIALVQIEVVTGELECNLRRARQLLSQAKEHGAQLAVLPELWTTGYDLERANQHSSRISDDGFGQIANLACEFEIYLCGSSLEARAGQYFNTQTVYSPGGRLLAAYSKIHLFGLMNEADFLTPGSKLITVDLPWGRAGLAICYDLRFPEMFRSYALGGAQLILLSAEWPQPRLEHWRTLLRARAIENQTFVVACNCVGQGNGNTFFGHSMAVDPWGEVLVEGQEHEEVLVAKLDLSRVDEIRQRYPVFADRRAGL
jgi:omega-amidase